MMLPLVIVNPSSAGGATESVWPRLASDLSTHFGAFNCAFTRRAGDGRRLAAEGARDGRRLIIACGGDGTISEVANGILESGEDVEIGILPSGTGGDFRRSIGTPARAADAARALRRGHTRRMDIGRATFINHDGVEESRYFLGVASFGMSAEVIERVKENSSEWLPNVGSRILKGKLSFALAMLQTTLSAEKKIVHVQVDDKAERRLTVTNLCIANARYFGGGMKIAPEAKLNDGQFDVVSIGDLSAAEILANAHQLYLGTHLGMRQVHHTRATRIHAQSADKDVLISLELDGELPGRLPATFEILPRALRVRCPS